MTSSTQIEKYLQKDIYFLGCYPHDKLPSFPSCFPKSIIINTDSGSGEHWVALVMTETACFYLDSYGLPIINMSILQYLHPYHKVTYSNICIQDVFSNKCAHFCVYFVTIVKNKVDYVNFLSCFNFRNLKENDIIVNSLL